MVKLIRAGCRMGVLWSQSGEGTSKTPQNTLATSPSRSWGPAPPLRAALTPSSILGPPWLLLLGPAVTQRQISSEIFPFHLTGKPKKRKKMRKKVFKMPLAKNLSHPLMPDVKSLASKELLPVAGSARGEAAC